MITHDSGRVLACLFWSNPGGPPHDLVELPKIELSTITVRPDGLVSTVTSARNQPAAGLYDLHLRVHLSAHGQISRDDDDLRPEQPVQREAQFIYS